MQDKIKNFDAYAPKIKLPKHGHTTIELKDIHTGVKEIHEDDNMITKALGYFLGYGGVANSFSNYNVDLVQELLGGIMLFDDEITENSENVVIPNGLNMTANMAIGLVNNSNPSELGSYSEAESGWQQDGSFVQVYNFTTTQGNGTIASAILTSRQFGRCGYGNASGTYQSSSDTTWQLDKNDGSIQSNLGSYKIFKVDEENGFAYAVRNSNVYYTSYGERENLFTYTGKINVIKMSLPFGKMDLRKSTILEETEYAVDSSFITAVGGTQTTPSMALAVDDGKLYAVQKNGSWATPINCMVISENGLSYNYISNPTGETLYYNTGTNRVRIYGGYVYLVKMTGSSTTDYTTVYKIRISDSALAQTISASINSSSIWNASQASYIKRGCEYANGALIDLQNDRIIVVNSASISAGNNYHVACPLKNNPLMYVSSEYNGISMLHRNQRYMASINNLESPVVKTADKTMKITYRLTF